MILKAQRFFLAKHHLRPPLLHSPVTRSKPPEEVKADVGITPPIQSTPQIPERANAPTPERPNGKRIITRNSFEIYDDQMDSLRKLSYQEKMEGKLGRMSGIVRDAIDTYLRRVWPRP